MPNPNYTTYTSRYKPPSRAKGEGNSKNNSLNRQIERILNEIGGKLKKILREGSRVYVSVQKFLTTVMQVCFSLEYFDEMFEMMGFFFSCSFLANKNTKRMPSTRLILLERFLEYHLN